MLERSDQTIFERLLEEAMLVAAEDRINGREQSPCPDSSLCVVFIIVVVEGCGVCARAIESERELARKDPGVAYRMLQ